MNVLRRLGVIIFNEEWNAGDAGEFRVQAAESGV